MAIASATSTELSGVVSPPSGNGAGVCNHDEIDANVADLAANFPELTPAQLDWHRENFRLDRDYPGKHVAYIDERFFENQTERLRRHVLAASADPMEIDRFCDSRPDSVRTTYIDGPDDPSDVLPEYC